MSIDVVVTTGLYLWGMGLHLEEFDTVLNRVILEKYIKLEILNHI